MRKHSPKHHLKKVLHKTRVARKRVRKPATKKKR